jgi:hypothetical protein
MRLWASPASHRPHLDDSDTLDTAGRDAGGSSTVPRVAASANEANRQVAVLDAFFNASEGSRSVPARDRNPRLGDAGHEARGMKDEFARECVRYAHRSRCFEAGSTRMQIRAPESSGFRGGSILRKQDSSGSRSAELPAPALTDSRAASRGRARPTGESSAAVSTRFPGRLEGRPSEHRARRREPAEHGAGDAVAAAGAGAREEEPVDWRPRAGTKEADLAGSRGDAV